MRAVFNRVLQKNSVCPFNIVFWLLIFTGRDASWPPRLGCRPGEHWSHRRNFSGISFLFGGIYVPVSSSLSYEICVTEKAFRGRGAEWRKVLWNQSCPQSFVCLVYYLVTLQICNWKWCTRSYQLDSPLVCQPWARLGKHSARKPFTPCFTKWNNAWNAFERITRENEGTLWSISVNSALPMSHRWSVVVKLPTFTWVKARSWLLKYLVYFSQE